MELVLFYAHCYSKDVQTAFAQDVEKILKRPAKPFMFDNKEMYFERMSRQQQVRMVKLLIKYADKNLCKHYDCDDFDDILLEIHEKKRLRKRS